MRFVGALEAVLDPLVAVSTCSTPISIPSLRHSTSSTSPPSGSGWSTTRRSRRPAPPLVLRTAELGRLRGTHAGVQLALEPQLPRPAVAGGGRRRDRVVEQRRAAGAGSPSFVVYCDQPISQEVAAEVARVIESVKPVHVGFRLRIKGPKREAAVEQ